MWPSEASVSGAAQPTPPRVVFSRGRGCAELAEMISPETTRVVGNLDDACLEARADLLVTRKPPGGFSLVSVASPVDLQPNEVSAVVAAVAGGPHSLFNVQLSQLLSERLGVEMLIANAFAGEEGQLGADDMLARMGELVPGAKQLSIQTADPTEFISILPPGSLLILGESGGSFLARMFFGPGARLRARAEAGVIIVRAAPGRVFQLMETPVFVGPHHLAGDSRRLHRESRIAVVENGHLVGLVDLTALVAAKPDAPVASLMSEPMALGAGMSLVEAASVITGSGRDLGGPWPVTDDEGVLIGTYRPT